MIRNYFKIAWRNLVRNKTFSFINVFGLTVGLTCFLLIAAFVYDELSYDRYAKESDNMYRVALHLDENGGTTDFPLVDAAVGRGIKEAFPEVTSFTRFAGLGQWYFTFNGQKFKENKVAFLDSNFLHTFSIPLMEGNQVTALTEPNSIILSKAVAIKYFDKEPAIGKLLTANDKTYKVTGVFDQLPGNSHFHFDLAISMSSLPARNETWSNVSRYTYLTLQPGTDPKKLEAKFPQLVAKYVVPEVQQDMGISLAEAQKSVNTFRFFLQPLTDIHLHSNTKYELQANGDINYLYIFGALAIFILLLACVNFTNLSTASAARRAREVGIRKVMGSLKGQLIAQFLAESILLSLLATVIALVALYFLLPAFNHLSGKDIRITFFLQVPSLLTAFGFSLLTGVLAGLYPSLVLSSFAPIKVLKGRLASQPRGHLLRSGLVVFQFVISTALIISTLIVYRQLNFMQNQKLGYDKDQVLVIQDTYAGLGANETAFKEKLKQDRRILHATTSWAIPTSDKKDGSQVYLKAEQQGETRQEIQSGIYRIDYDYIPTLGMKVVAGRNFSPDFPSDSSGVVINETAVKSLGIRGNPLGRTIVRSGQIEYTIVGVVQDFHTATARQKIAPLMMLMGRNGGTLMAKVKTTDIKKFLTDTKAAWESFSPSTPFTYMFLDEQFATLYAAEEKSGQLFTVFAVISIVIACLGLFGLVAYTVEQRTREIGIRKVLGASIQQVLLLVSKEFLYLVGIALVVAIPASWWVMTQWLEDFAYRTTINAGVFVVAGFIALAIAAVTISFQAIKAALMNPVKSLRSE
ncbi:ABC transporter permease [Paraflavitalea sp. CAU 1676]|uniref:ABC transporter permease n=1 Tax=Paraflavitalea sp. CAU 1676 TaxID=3032598 RepID=UPI0023DCC3F6|nr:ABC transporter permease [Paraflavitalea sp. CAU 1676]MDF2192022.1 ABC transporter permease [Paraflavitalea sp. CAU 1676]